MRSFPAVGWTVTHVHSSDMEHPSAARPARVLLNSARTAGFVCPVRSEGHQLYGTWLDHADEAVWRPLSPTAQWAPDQVPIFGPAGRLEFITRGALDRRRHQEAERLVRAAVQSEAVLQARRGLAELADGLLGGHVVPLAAAMHLARGDEARTARLRTRYLRAAPQGVRALERALKRFPGIHHEPALADRLRAAASEALAERLDPRAWAAVREETLARWWLRWRMASASLTLTALGRQLGVPSRRLRDLLRSRHPLDSALQALLPEPQAMHAQLAEVSRGVLSSALEASLADAHQPRLAAFARQLGTLERMTDRTERLDRWASAAPGLALDHERIQRINIDTPFERARYAAENLRRDVLKTDVFAALDLDQCLDPIGGALSAAALAAPGLLAGSVVTGETGPVLTLGPRAAWASIGVTRFVVAHQIGHVLTGADGGETAPCTLASTDAVADADPHRHEAFANAFAVYLLAPRPAVLSLVGRLDRDPPERVVDAARDVALTFGLSANAALRHTLNCLDFRGEDFERALRGALRWDGWAERRQSIDQDTETAFEADRIRVDKALGQDPMVWDLETALARPRSTRFDGLIDQAEALGELDPATAQALRVA